MNYFKRTLVGLLALILSGTAVVKYSRAEGLPGVPTDEEANRARQEVFGVALGEKTQDEIDAEKKAKEEEAKKETQEESTDSDLPGQDSKEGEDLPGQGSSSEGEDLPGQGSSSEDLSGQGSDLPGQTTPVTTTPVTNTPVTTTPSQSGHDPDLKEVQSTVLSAKPTMPEHMKESINLYANLASAYKSFDPAALNSFDPNKEGQDPKIKATIESLTELVKRTIINNLKPVDLKKEYSTDPYELAMSYLIKFEEKERTNPVIKIARAAVVGKAVDGYVKAGVWYRRHAPLKKDGTVDKNSREYKLFLKLYNQGIENGRFLMIDDDLYKEYYENLLLFRANMKKKPEPTPVKEEKYVPREYTLEELLVYDISVAEQDLWRILKQGYENILRNNIENKAEMDNLKFILGKYKKWDSKIIEIANDNTPDKYKPEFKEKRKQLSGYLKGHIEIIEKELNKGDKMYEEALALVKQFTKSKQKIEGQDKKITNKKEMDPYDKLYLDIVAAREKYNILSGFWDLGTEKSFNDIVQKLQEIEKDAEGKIKTYAAYLQNLKGSAANEYASIRAIMRKQPKTAKKKAIVLGNRLEGHINNYGPEFNELARKSYKTAAEIEDVTLIVKPKHELKPIVKSRTWYQKAWDFGKENKSLGVTMAASLLALLAWGAYGGVKLGKHIAEKRRERRQRQLNLGVNYLS